MDRGIPIKVAFQVMREPEPQTCYLGGTPKGRMKELEKKWLEWPELKVRDSV